MNYKNAYLHLFTRLSDTIDLLETCDARKENVNFILLLKEIQCEGEKAAIQVPANRSSHI